VARLEPALHLLGPFGLAPLFLPVPLLVPLERPRLGQLLGDVADLAHLCQNLLVGRQDLAVRVEQLEDLLRRHHALF
jgi:hypothetical protein